MLQTPVQYRPRKRLAEAPLDPVHPSKTPRVTANDNPKTILARITGIFSTSSTSVLPMHSKDSLPQLSQASTAHATSSKPPPTQPPKSTFRSSAPNGHSSHSKDRRRPSGCDNHRRTPSGSSSQPSAPTESVNRSRTGSISLGSKPKVYSGRPRRNSSDEPSRPESLKHANFSRGPAPAKASTSIVHASRWRTLSSATPPDAPSASSTSRATQDSASSSFSGFDSGTDRPTSSVPTSIASQSTTPSGFDSSTPEAKSSQYHPLPSTFDAASCNFPLRPLGPSATLQVLPSSKLSTSSSRTSTSSSLFNTSFKYSPSQDLSGSGMMYRPGSVTRSKPSRKRAKSRKHIYHDQHKVAVAFKKKEIKKTVDDYFDVAKRHGFLGTKRDYEELADYAVTAHEAVTGKRTDDDQDTAIWFPKWLDKAHKSFSTPRPKPFVPTLDQLHRTLRAKDAAIEDRLRPPRPQLPTSLPPEDELLVDNIFRKRGVIAKVARECVSDLDIARLRPRQWLNDEIINFYGALIMQRVEEQKENAVPRGKVLRAFYLSSFFWAKLTSSGYEKGRLAKWTKKLDLFAQDVVLIPVNHGNAHWTAASINFRKKRFESYDSMGMAKEGVWKQLREYVNDEHMNKKKKPFNFDGWVDWAPSDTPQQDNGFDCGVFTCQFLESLSRGEDEFIFGQENMSYLRRKMVWEIANVRIRNDL